MRLFGIAGEKEQDNSVVDTHDKKRRLKGMVRNEKRRFYKSRIIR